jgi:hypothetical protein
VLLRGAQFDRSGLVGFGENPLIGQLPPGRTINEADDDYRTAPGGTCVGGPGSAWQVDGLDFSYLIVFGVDMMINRSTSETRGVYRSRRTE